MRGGGRHPQRWPRTGSRQARRLWTLRQRRGDEGVAADGRGPAVRGAGVGAARPDRGARGGAHGHGRGLRGDRRVPLRAPRVPGLFVAARRRRQGHRAAAGAQVLRRGHASRRDHLRVAAALLRDPPRRCPGERRRGQRPSLCVPPRRRAEGGARRSVGDAVGVRGGGEARGVCGEAVAAALLLLLRLGRGDHGHVAPVVRGVAQPGWLRNRRGHHHRRSGAGLRRHEWPRRRRSRAVRGVRRRDPETVGRAVPARPPRLRRHRPRGKHHFAVLVRRRRDPPNAGPAMQNLGLDRPQGSDGACADPPHRRRPGAPQRLPL
mmetsp:Transcript_95708/g.270891  ORF Transcript_95708/g.270891 Transcript_95708/m.270891 type:complete len:320 (-) Transcript_95708:902-1861(-)